MHILTNFTVENSSNDSLLSEEIIEGPTCRQLLISPTPAFFCGVAVGAVGSILGVLGLHLMRIEGFEDL